MSLTIKRLTANTTQLTTSPTVLYTASSVKAQILSGVVLNTSASTITITLYLVPATGSPVDANMVIKQKSLLAGESYRLTELVGLVLGAGDSIQALASAGTAASVTIGGAEYT